MTTMGTDMYEYTDKMIRYLTKRFIRLFENAKSNLLPMDEVNILNYSKSMYDELEKMTETYLLKLAQKVYENTAQNKKRKIDKKWLCQALSEYDPVTMYVYLHEVDRKRARFAEAVMASTNRASEVDKALRYWSRMVNQYAVEITDKAVIDAYVDDEVSKVVWVTVDDEKRCRECAERDGKIYDIDDIPPKPHLNCRCIVLPYFGEE
jgi:SPP1 gp7 family putative phage head morphogenesis protein